MFSQSEKFINTEFYIKNDLTKNLKELNELRKENNLIKYEIDSYEKNLNEENLTIDNVKQVLNLYSAKISNMTNRYENTENAFHKLVKAIELQSSAFRLEDTFFVKNLASRLAKTIEMYEDLSKKLKESEEKLIKYEKRDLIDSLKQQQQQQQQEILAQETNYLNTSKIIYQIKKFIKTNNVKKSIIAHRVLGISKIEFLKLISKATPWICCKPKKRGLFIRLKTFLNNSSEVTELLNYLLIERTNINKIENQVCTKDSSQNGSINRNFIYNVNIENDLIDNEDDDIEGDEGNVIDDDLDVNMNEIIKIEHQENSLAYNDEDEINDLVINDDYDNDEMEQNKQSESSTHDLSVGGGDNYGDEDFLPEGQNLCQFVPINGFGRHINIEELSKKVHKFLIENNITNAKFANDILQLSRRSFNRVINNKINWNNCKPVTKGYLYKLDAFLNDKSEMQAYLASINNGKIYTFNPQIVEQQAQQIQTTEVNDDLDETQADYIDPLAYPDDLNLDREELSRRARKFLEMNGLNYAFVGQNLFGISRRSFNRLVNDISIGWQNCKPATRERLVKLKNFLDDENSQREFLNKFCATRRVVNTHAPSLIQKTTNKVVNDNVDEDEEEDDDVDIAPTVPLSTQTGQVLVDVKSVSKQIYKFLQTHKISQRTFAQKVLGITKNRFNKLICKPPTWHTCKSTTKHHYIQIQAFLKDQKRIKDFLTSVISDRQNEYDLKKGNLSTLSFNLTSNNSKFFDQVENEDDEEEDVYEENDENNENNKSNENDQALSSSLMTLDESFYSNLDLNINTFELAKQVDQFLKLKKINEAYFAIKVLNIDLNLFKRLVAKPEAWNILNKSDRIYYIKLKLFLSDLNKINLFLSSYQNHLKATNMIKM